MGAKNGKTSKNRTTIAYVRWFDSAIYKDEPCQAEDLTGFMENESSGLLVKESKDDITIALDRCLESDNLRLVLCIPRANIRFLRKIRI